jgi:hypothetical protein
LQDQLTDVQRVFSSTLAFAALKGDGSVVAWGPWYAGGDASNVQDLEMVDGMGQRQKCGTGEDESVINQYISTSNQGVIIPNIK